MKKILGIALVIGIMASVTTYTVMALPASTNITNEADQLLLTSASSNDFAYEPRTTHGYTFGYKAGTARIIQDYNGVAEHSFPAGTIQLNTGWTYIYADLVTNTIKTVNPTSQYLIYPIAKVHLNENGIIDHIFDLVHRPNTLQDESNFIKRGDPIPIGTVDSLPDISEDSRGQMVILQGDQSHSDILYICLKDASGNLSWIAK